MSHDTSAALHAAVLDGHAQAVTALLAADADGSVRDADGRTPSDLAEGVNRDRLEGTKAWWCLHDAQYE